MTYAARDPRQQDETHLAFVRKQPCCVCGSRREIEAAHIRYACNAVGKRPTGMGEKPHDRWTVSLCAYHHRTGIDSQHNNNEREWWIMRGLNPFTIAAELWKASGGEDRAATPKPVKQPRKIKSRQPRDKRKKIPAGRPLKSNPVIQSRGFPKRDEHRTTS